MKKYAYRLCLVFGVSLLIMGCDTAETLNQPRAETRTMIIGGMPVHDHDYKVLQTESAWNEPSAQQQPD